MGVSRTTLVWIHGAMFSLYSLGDFGVPSRSMQAVYRGSGRLEAKRPPSYFWCILFGNHYNTTLSILGLPNVCALEKSIFCCLLLGFPFSTGGWGGSSSGCRGDADMLKANACGQ
jgi:hypothetical protein